MDRTNAELTHILNNKLSVIMAMCDRLYENATDPRVVAGLRVIHTAAQTLDEFNKPLGRSTGA